MSFKRRNLFGIIFFVFASAMLLAIGFHEPSGPLERCGSALFVAGCAVCGVGIASAQSLRWFDLGNTAICLGVALVAAGYF